MRHQPSGRDLLEAARQALREELAKSLTGRERYVALMAANAIAIASRQMVEDPRGPENLATRLGRLLGEEGGDPWSLDWTLAERLRAGEFGPGEAGHRELHRYLVDRAAAALEESNPRYVRE